MATKQLLSSFTRLVLPLCVLVLLLGAPSHRAEAQCTPAPCVDSADIVNGSIKRVDLALKAVGAAQLGDGAVTSSSMALSAIQSFAIAAGAVETAHISPHAVGTQQIGTGAVRTPNIAFGAVGACSPTSNRTG